MKHLIRKSLTAAAAVAILGVAAHANALPIGYTLTLSGSADSPYMTLGNTSAAALITGFSISIGDTLFNFDRVGFQTTPTDAGGDLTALLGTPDLANGGARSDILSYFFGGFDAGDVFEFRAELDPDSGNGPVDYRAILYNNGGADNAIVAVTFEEGSFTDTLETVLTDGGRYDGSRTFSHAGFLDTAPPDPHPNPSPIPEPTSMALFGLGLTGLGLLARRRRMALIQ